MRERGAGGAIVNILSINVHCGAPELAVYSASKAALALAHQERRERPPLRPHPRQRHQYRLDADTRPRRMMQAETLGHGPGWLDAAEPTQPFGRLLAAEEVANLARLPAQRRGRADDRRAHRPGAVGRGSRAVTERLGPALLGRLPAARAPPGLRPRRARRRAWRISASARSIAATRPSTPTTCSSRASTAGASSASTSALRRLADSLGRQDGLYTRAAARGRPVEARVIGSMLQVVDSQDESRIRRSRCSPSPEIDVVTMTVTEKGYCHRRPAASSTRTIPTSSTTWRTRKRRAACRGCSRGRSSCGMQSHGRPLTLVSCDNIPATARSSAAVVRRSAERRGARARATGSPRTPPSPRRWSTASPRRRRRPTSRRSSAATATATRPSVGRRAVPPMGHREPLRRPRAALGSGRRARSSTTSTPFEHLKMRVLNAAQSTLAYLGVLAGHEHTCDDGGGPAAGAFRAAMLIEESLPTLPPVPGIAPRAYVEQSLERLRNTRHPPPQPPDRHRRLAEDRRSACSTRPPSGCARGEAIALLAVPVAAWMAYLIRASAASATAGRPTTHGGAGRGDRRPGRATMRRRSPPRSSAHRRDLRPGARGAAASSAAIASIGGCLGRIAAIARIARAGSAVERRARTA